MARLLLYNIQQLLQIEDQAGGVRRGAAMAELPSLDNAYLLIEDGKIHSYGSWEGQQIQADQRIDASGRFVLPTWCDSHTHLVFAASRESEFVDRINGLSYQEIAQKGGGILNSARRLRETPESELLEQAYSRLMDVIALGTGAIEIKSGYGLSVEGELKMLRVIQQLKERSPIPIKATFLGAHALPLEYRSNRSAYIDLILENMLPIIAEQNLADYIDVFCEKNFFSVEETEQLIQAGQQYGLKAKIHTNQFNCMGGIQASVRNGALSVDHLEVLNDEEIACLRESNTMSTLLPSAPFFLNDHYPPARKMLAEGLESHGIASLRYDKRGVGESKIEGLKEEHKN